MTNKYDIIVVGAGHAGIEAAWFSSGMGMNVALMTIDKRRMGKPSCNPSIGGSAKGHLVKELDAMGGAMPMLADRAGLQFKILNRSKGPAIWSPRAQIDKDLYPRYVLDLMLKRQNITLLQGTAKEVIIENHKAIGVVTTDDTELYANAIILCPGTFLNGLMFVGEKSFEGGRLGEPSSYLLAEKLAEHGLKTGRLKTGTPPRIHKNSIDYSKIEMAGGDEYPNPFSMNTKRVSNRIMCYMTGTNDFTHEILRTGFDRSPMYSGIIEGAGPRYCPSIEDKIVRFSGRNSHKIVLEPEGLNTDSVYVNGYSTSLPEDVQLKGLHTIRGLEAAVMMRPGYAIEYDFFYPYQLRYTLETKLIENLYMAGQLNGTSGYEEAAVQGMIAGINASLKIMDREPLILSRSEAYTGVLIDDLVNKSTEEPYRIFTSLAEYRLLLRQDNADKRLMKYAHDIGMAPDIIYESMQKKYNNINDIIETAHKVKLKPEKINKYLEEAGESPVQEKTSIYDLAKRSKTELNKLFAAKPKYDKYKTSEYNAAGIEIKYEGYIKRQQKEIDYFLENEKKAIPELLDYDKLTSLSNEAREKLKLIRPKSLGQASRISGVSASDVSILTVYLK